MAVTRSITRKQNHDARKRSKTSDNDNNNGWASLTHDLLIIIMMRIGAVDFIPFSTVCKSWRTLALPNKKKFLASRQPVSFITSARNQECCFEDFQKRKVKTVIPKSSGKVCVGLTWGYLIFFCRKTNDFWLMNPVTRHGLHFPRYTYHVGSDITNVKGVLVYSPSMSDYVFVVSRKSSSIISFSSSSNKTRWNHLNCVFPVRDIHFFKGKIYTINLGAILCEVKVNPNPALTLMSLKSVRITDFKCPQFASWNGKLYVLDHDTNKGFGALEADLDQMKWALPDKRIGEYAYHISYMKCGNPTSVDMWVDPGTKDEKSSFDGHDDDNSPKTKKGRFFFADLWYFPHECLEVNRLLE